ncbi:MAG TPA: hypothetical protein GX507_09090 [Clostridia bacterium]|nr:hypothetical protein [Clostridia bacterium]
MCWVSADDLIVFVKDPQTETEARLLAQIKHSISITEGNETFVQQRGGPFAEVFQYYLYGPFSEQLANEVEEMKSFGPITETSEVRSSNQDIRYEVTDQGRRLLRENADDCDLQVPEEIIRELAQLDARDLELKATVLFLSRLDCPVEEIEGIVRRLKPDHNYSTSEVADSLKNLLNDGS